MDAEDFVVPFLVLSEIVSVHLKYRSGGRALLEMDIAGPKKKLIDILLQCGSGAFLSPNGIAPMPYATPFLKMIQCAIGEIGDSNAIKTSIAAVFSGEMMVRLPMWKMNQTLTRWLTQFDRELMDKILASEIGAHQTSWIMDAVFIPLVKAFVTRHDELSFDAHKTYIIESCRLLVEACGTFAVGKFLSMFLGLWGYNGKTFFVIAKEFLVRFHTATRANLLRGMLGYLEMHVLDQLSIYGIPAGMRVFSRGGTRKAMGFVDHTAGMDESYLRHLLNFDVYLPRMGISFLSIQDYFMRNFALFKASVSLQIWSEVMSACSPERAVNTSLYHLSRGTFHQIVPRGKRGMDEEKKLVQRIRLCLAVTEEEDDASFLAMCKTEHIIRLSSAFSVLQSIRNRSKGHAYLIHISPEGIARRLTSCAFHSEWYTKDEGQMRVFVECDIPSANKEALDHIGKESFPYNFFYFVSSTMSSFHYVLDHVNDLEAAGVYEESRSSASQLGRQIPKVLTGSLSEESMKLVQRAFVRSLPPRFLLKNCVESFDDVWSFMKNCKNFRISVDDAFETSCQVGLSGGAASTVDIHFGEWDTPFRPYRAQQHAILSSLLCSITCIIGPPGTGKTDVAVHVIAEMFRLTNGREMIVIVTHSNLALDQLIERLALRDVAVLRIGNQGVSDIAQRSTAKGRFQACLNDLSSSIDQLSSMLNLHPDATDASEFTTWMYQLWCSLNEDKYSPKTLLVNAQKFDQVLRMMQDGLQYIIRLSSATSDDILEREIMSFVGRFRLPLSAANPSVIRKIAMIHKDLIEAIQLLKMRQSELEMYFMSRLCVVGATCSGLAMRKRSLFSNFKKPVNIIVEEAGKILETESVSLFSMLPERLVLVGDELQLSPILKDDTLKYDCRYNQSIFQRLQTLGIQPIMLNMQGRARPALARLYRWRYEAAHGVSLLDLPATMDPSFDVNPPGMQHPSQFIDVTSRGRGEENEHEADYCVALFHYLLKHGNASDSISVLTPYNKQKRLLSSKFSHLPDEMDPPRDISTTDEFQGKQNEIIIISLVQSGEYPSRHLRDAQRLNVMTSRARKALVIMGSIKTFKTADEWNKIFENLSTSSVHFGALYPGKTEIHSQRVCKCARDLEDFLKFSLGKPSSPGSEIEVGIRTASLRSRSSSDKHSAVDNLDDLERAIHDAEREGE
eukprot:TRINITY_DN643_c1_g2_i2.p1 TRINITY_DN643_c1_g2~~TRINITY_DN643_c1_g2_i2.p1  ORF type:complete len:1326 (+),score=349.18 TRINITY_DN643_c1_g2_i2:425-3979(+)